MTGKCNESMPWKVDPNSGTDQVGETYTIIARSLSIGLPLGTLIAVCLWGLRNGFDHFF
tara:strand:+ start:141 stop:317 length:177 start_codon:yes stop_codon:yes gene_type:complete